MRILFIALASLMLTGCIVRTAADVVTAPVRAVGQVADWATTSQDEADRNRGRELREEEERLGRAYRECREDAENDEELYDCEDIYRGREHMREDRDEDRDED